MSVNVREYIKDNDKLELSYLGYAQKMELVDTILENVIDYNTHPATVDTSMLKIISIELFIQNITNLDLSPEANGDENGYDILCYSGALSHLLELIAPEYNRLQEILNDRLNDFYRYEYSPVKAIYDIKDAVDKALSDSADYLNNAIRNIDIEKIMEMIPQDALKAGGLS